jgi:hypothetical protein
MCNNVLCDLLLNSKTMTQMATGHALSILSRLQRHKNHGHENKTQGINATKQLAKLICRIHRLFTVTTLAMYSIRDARITNT